MKSEGALMYNDLTELEGEKKQQQRAFSLNLFFAHTQRIKGLVLKPSKYDFCAGRKRRRDFLLPSLAVP